MTRAELYALVWETPSIHVASQLGMSNAALRKLCATYDVPLPPAGYWTKVGYGKEPPRTPLPAAAPTLLKKIADALRTIGQVSIDLADAQIADYHLDLSAVSPSGRKAGERRQLVDHFARRLGDSSPDEEGFIAASLRAVIECRVGARSQARAVVLFDALIEMALRFDFLIDGERGLFFDGEQVALRIYETQAARPPIVPSGHFCLELYDPRPLEWTRRNLIGHWHDRAGRPVEQMTRTAVAAAINAAPLVRCVRDAIGRKDKLQHSAMHRPAEARRG